MNKESPAISRRRFLCGEWVAVRTLPEAGDESAARVSEEIASLVVRVHPDRMDAAREAMAALPGVEVHTANTEGRMVVTVECGRDAGLTEVMAQLSDVEGVLSILLVYHYGDDEQDTESDPESGTGVRS